MSMITLVPVNQERDRGKKSRLISDAMKSLASLEVEIGRRNRVARAVARPQDMTSRIKGRHYSVFVEQGVRYFYNPCVQEEKRVGVY